MPKNAGNLCVDLDGTLIRSDSLWELILRALRHNPFYILFNTYSPDEREMPSKAEAFGKILENS